MRTAFRRPSRRPERAPRMVLPWAAEFRRAPSHPPSRCSRSYSNRGSPASSLRSIVPALPPWWQTFSVIPASPVSLQPVSGGKVRTSAGGFPFPRRSPIPDVCQNHPRLGGTGAERPLASHSSPLRAILRIGDQHDAPTDPAPTMPRPKHRAAAVTACRAIAFALVLAGTAATAREPPAAAGGNSGVP